MQEITEDMTVEAILDRYPKAVKIFMDMGIPCLVCGEPSWDTLKETAERHGVDLSLLVQRLNDQKEQG